MGAITISWTHVAIIVIGALGLYLLELVLFLVASRREGRRASAAEERLEALTIEVKGLVDRIAALEGEIDRVRRQPQTSGQYREAVSMAERGEDPRMIAETCGLSLGEAELIAALHRSRT